MLENFKTFWTEISQTKEYMQSILTLVFSIITCTVGGIVYIAFSNWLLSTLGVIIVIGGVVLFIMFIITFAMAIQLIT